MRGPRKGFTQACVATAPTRGRANGEMLPAASAFEDTADAEHAGDRVASRDRERGKTDQTAPVTAARGADGTAGALLLEPQTASGATPLADYFLTVPIGSTTLPYSSFQTWAIDAYTAERPTKMPSNPATFVQSHRPCR